MPIMEGGFTVKVINEHWTVFLDAANETAALAIQKAIDEHCTNIFAVSSIQPRANQGDLLDALRLAEATIVRLDKKGSAVGTLDVIRDAIKKAEA